VSIAKPQPTGFLDAIPDGARVCAAHQPNLLPWAGYMAKLQRADVFVIADTVQYVKQNFINRCKVSEKNGGQWLSIPVLRHGKLGQTEREVKCDYAQNWVGKFCRGLRYRYGKSPLFPRLGEKLLDEFATHHDHLLDLNVALLKILMNELGINTPVYLLSELGVTSNDKCGRIIAITNAVKCTHYLAGKGGSKGYLTSRPFEKAGLSYSFYSFKEEPYPQPSKEFIPGCSIIDCLFRHGVPFTQKQIGMCL